jgi:zinc transporter ZupT
MENSETPNNEQINGDNPFAKVPAVSLGENALIYGLILGGITVVYSIVLWLLDLSTNKSLGYIGFLFALGVMFYGTKEYRDKQLGGYMMYGKAFTSNFLIGLYSAIIGTIFFFFLVKYIDLGLLDKMKEIAIKEAMKKPGHPPLESIEKGINFFMTPVVLSVIGLLMNTFFTTGLALFISIFHKKEQPLF